MGTASWRRGDTSERRGLAGASRVHWDWRFGLWACLLAHTSFWASHDACFPVLHVTIFFSPREKGTPLC